MAFLTDLDEVLRERGVKVKTHSGWKTRGYNGLSFTEVRGTLWHHTATNRSAFVGNDAPTLNLCMYGRADLAGPLCQIVLGRDGTAHVIAAGWGNHAGYGSYKGIPTNQGNAYLIGVEMESSGLPPYDWTPAQLATIPVLRDALRDGYGHKTDIGHMEWSSQGKIDPAGLPGGMNWLRTAKASTTTAAAGTITKDWFDMATSKDLDAAIDRGIKRNGLANGGWGYTNPKVEKADAYAILRVTRDNAQRAVREGAARDAQISNLVSAVAALAKGEKFDEAKLLAGVKAAAEAGVKNAVDSIETTVNIKESK